MNTPDAFEQVFACSPLAMAVVTGELHVLEQANPSYDLMLASGAPPVARTAMGEPLANAFPAPAALVLVGVLDAVRTHGCVARGMVPAFAGTGGASDAWPCVAWPLARGSDAIGIAIDATSASTRSRVAHRDVTERVLLSHFREGERADAAEAGQREAQVSNAERGYLLATTSHEIRSPLQAIGGYARLLEMGLRGPVTDGQRDALTRIQQAMAHVLGLTTALLDHARTEADRLAYDLTDVPLAGAIADAASLVELKAEEFGIAVHVAACDDVGARADAGKVRQVLLNLMGNALKFTPRGGSVTVSCEALPADVAGALQVAVHVSDTGIGIPTSALESIFDPYKQVGRRLASPDAGVGLGLAISRTLAVGMGGTLDVRSQMGVGSTFTLRLPRVVAAP